MEKLIETIILGAPNQLVSLIVIWWLFRRSESKDAIIDRLLDRCLELLDEKARDQPEE